MKAPWTWSFQKSSFSFLSDVCSIQTLLPSHLLRMVFFSQKVGIEIRGLSGKNPARNASLFHRTGLDTFRTARVRFLGSRSRGNQALCDVASNGPCGKPCLRKSCARHDCVGRGAHECVDICKDFSHPFKWPWGGERPRGKQDSMEREIAAS